MNVIKRDGTFQNVQFDKITSRISHLATDLQVQPVLVAQKVCGQLIDGIQTSILDEISAQICMSMYNIHPDYNVLGSRILVDNHIKNTPTSMKIVSDKLSHILDKDFIQLVQKHYLVYDEMVDFQRDFLIDYFGMKTLMKSYLLKNDNGIIIERPQHLWLRVAIFLHKDNFDAVKETYDWLSTKHFTHASPTLFNAGTRHPQLSSCFVKGTLVNTINRGSIPIENVLVGDQVVTHTGNCKSVVQLHQNKLGNRKLYQVNYYNTPSFIVTEDHRLWTYNSETREIKWTRVDELTIYDYTSVPNIHTEETTLSLKEYKFEQIISNNDDTTAFSRDTLVLTNDIMWLFGILVRKGIVIYTKKRDIGGIFINVQNEPSFIQQIYNIVTNDLNISPDVIDRNDTTICIHSKHLGILTQALSQTIPYQFYRLSRELICNWLSGFACDFIYNLDKHFDLDVSIHETKLLNDIYNLCRLHNIAISDVKISESNKTMCIDGFYYGLVENQPFLNTNVRNINGTTFVKYLHKTQVSPNNTFGEFVYTLGIEDEHSYSINGLIAENCFLTTIEDSVEGIFKTLGDCALISKWAGGIGVNISDIRGNNSIIRGTNGITQGILPLLKTYNATGRYINQCFTGSTTIYTKSGPKAIQNIVPNIDYVLTSDGSFKKVLGKIENVIDKSILQIQNTHSLEPIECTDEHQIYISRDRGETCQFISASELCEGDWMVYPIPQEVVMDDIRFTSELCRLYGILLANGFIKDGWLQVCIHLRYKSTIQFLINYFNEYAIEGLYCTFKTKMSREFPIPEEWFYPFEKAIYSKCLHLPIPKLIRLLYGLFEAQFNNKNSPILCFENKNRLLIESIRYIFLRLKTLVTGVQVIKEGIQYNQLYIPINKNLFDLIDLLDINLFDVQYNYTNDNQWIEKDTILLTKIKSITNTHFKGNVYDLQIDKNHNYTTHMGIVHNSGKRLGSFAMYIEPWHSDIFDFLNAKKNQGADEERARDLFYALWIPDLFMERVLDNGVWSLMCPDTCRGLTSTYGNTFNDLYTKYEKEGKFVKQIKARQIWDAIIESQIETGVPYMMYKDAVNKKSPQENIGVIKQSNLCTEIALYTDSKHISVCNLASIALPSFIDTTTMTFDFEKLEKVVRVITRNLNKVIDLTYYPVKEAKFTNLKHRPIGIGIQGLADVFAIFKWPFDSEKSRHLNKCIFETIYYASLSESCKLAKKDGSYDYFDGSPMSKGILQFDMWDPHHIHPSNRYDWYKLKEEIKKWGLRNSTLIAPMPTASTSQIMGFNECIVEGTLITDIHGISRPIEAIETNHTVLSLNEHINKLVNNKVVDHLDQGLKTVVKLELIDGRVIECTPDHKFRVCNTKTKQFEWLEADRITRDYSLVMGLRGIIDKYTYDDDFDVQFFSNYLPNPTEERCLALARLIGFVLTDGNYVDKTRTILHVDTLYDSQLILHDLEILDVTKSFHLTDNNLNITIDISQPITNLICKILENCKEPDFDISHNTISTVSDIFVPPLLLDKRCPNKFIREFLAGYCGGDGLSPFLKWTNNECKMAGCNIVRAVSTDNVQKMDKFMCNIKDLFERIGIITTMQSKEYIYNNSYTRVFVLKFLNLTEFTNYVGYRYHIHKMLRLEVYQTVFNYIKTIRKQRYEIINQIFKRYGTKDILEIYTEVIHQYENIFLHQQSIPDLDYVRQCLQKKSIIDTEIHINIEQFLKEIGVLEWFLKNSVIVEKTKLCLPVYCIPFLHRIENEKMKRVYDLNIQDTYSFVANGIVVHNCIEPFTSNLYVRRTLAGEFTCINKYLIRDLHDLGLWTNDMMEKLIYYKGSVQYIKEIPQSFKDIYKTVWEIKQRSLIEMAADRGVYVCQSQSLNLFFNNPNYNILTSAHFLGWQKGLKTGSYYIRSQSAIDAQNFTIDPLKEKELEKEKEQQQQLLCPLRPKGSSYEPCEACSG